MSDTREAMSKESRKANCFGDKLRILKAKGFLEKKGILGLKFIAYSFDSFYVTVAQLLP